jgi:hypothetical protein
MGKTYTDVEFENDLFVHLVMFMGLFFSKEEGTTTFGSRN